MSRINKRTWQALTLWALSAIVVLSSTAAEALPGRLDDYDVIEGGLANIEEGAIVEGSTRQGGIQPDYHIDIHVEPLKGFLARVEARVGRSNQPFWEKVNAVRSMVESEYFRYDDYSNPYYRRLLRKYRIANQDIPLSAYGVCRAGVCRENALVLHFALKAAGIPNLHAYARINRASRTENFDVTEDHAFTVVEHEGTKWVVDSYYWGFDGFRLEDLMSPEGITKDSPHAPIADPQPGTRRIIKINAFPRIYNPKPAIRRCMAIFAN